MKPSPLHSTCFDSPTLMQSPTLSLSLSISLSLPVRRCPSPARPTPSSYPIVGLRVRVEAGRGRPLWGRREPSATRAWSGLSVAMPDVNRVEWRGKEERERLLLLASLVLTQNMADGIADGRRRRSGAVEEKRKKSHQSHMLAAPTLEAVCHRPSRLSIPLFPNNYS